MSDEDNIVYLRDHPAATGPEGNGSATLDDGAGAGLPPDDFDDEAWIYEEDEPPPPKLKKLRIAVILACLGALAMISTVFGMMMAVASDLPDLENQRIYNGAQNSRIFDSRGRQIGLITGSQNQVLVGYSAISPAMRNAVISIEDQRFWENDGVDFRGIARALFQDILRREAVQGGSTITQQFVKNATQAQQERTIFNKLRESALAFHLTRKWSKQKILTQYLNAIYFGNGAYGVESAARTYFRMQAGQPVCNAPGKPPYCSRILRPHQAALLAGIIASPAAYDPVAHPVAAKERRDLVLRKMLEQGAIDRMVYEESVRQAIPTRDEVQPPREESQAPYFTTWVKQQIVERFGAQEAFAGGLRIKTTLDLDLQRSAQNAVTQHLSGLGPNGALVAIDNRTGGVLAMVGGTGDYNDQPFNIALNGQRQPGSAFKPFILARALEKGITPESVWTSKKKLFKVPNSADEEYFVVTNDADSYAGSTTLAEATAQSDNSVYAEIGIKEVGTRRVAKLARQMGIRTPVSSNYAMTLGGLKEGVTPLDMAHAYQTFARRGLRTWGTLGSDKRGPVALVEVQGRNGRVIAANRRKEKRVLPQSVSDRTVQLLESVITSGTGTEAQIDGFAAGKTGTTENYGDAWFVGFNEYITTAVWVGYSDRLKPMKTEYAGSPVKGGTIPADIWQQFMSEALATLQARGELNDKPDRILPNGLPASEASPSFGGDTGTTDSDGDGIPDDSDPDSGVVPDESGVVPEDEGVVPDDGTDDGTGDGTGGGFDDGSGDGTTDDGTGGGFDDGSGGTGVE